MRRYWLVIAAVFAACCIGPASAQAEAATNASVTVKDQAVVSNGVIGNVTVEKVVSDGPGWIAIHNNIFGHPGGVIGYSPVKSGENQNVTVIIHTFVAADTLFAVLHHDYGQEGVFEYPVPDVEQRVNDKIVIEPFNITAENTTLMNMTELCQKR